MTCWEMVLPSLLLKLVLLLQAHIDSIAFGEKGK